MNTATSTGNPLERIVSLQPAMLAGRCADGMERGHGVRVHGLLNVRRNFFTDVYGEALCGAKPGRRSAGWTALDGREITCQRCLRKLKPPTNAALTGCWPKE